MARVPSLPLQLDSPKGAKPALPSPPRNAVPAFAPLDEKHAKPAVPASPAPASSALLLSSFRFDASAVMDSLSASLRG